MKNKIIILFSIALFFIGCKNEDIEINVSSIKIGKEILYLKVGEKHKLTAEALPTTAINKDLIWSSKNTSVAKVDDDGNVNAISVGETEIIVYTLNEVSASCKVYVCPILAQELKLNKNIVSLEVDSCIKLEAIIYPTDVTSQKIMWHSSNNDVVTVDSTGMVKAISLGSALVTAMTDNGIKDTCRITNVKIVQDITLDKTSISSVIGTIDTLHANILPADATNQNIKWSSSNDIVVSVNNGVISAKSLGNTVISATTHNGKTAICNVIVLPIEETSLSLNYTSLNLYIGETYLLVASISPSNATYKDINWQTNASSIVDVNSEGVVTANGVGTGIITATTHNGKTITCQVNVSELVRNNIEDGKVKALFSVSANRKVYFSMGNLQYQASTKTWKFAESQTDYIGGNNEKRSETYAGWIDLFAYGTSGWNSGAECYQPYCGGEEITSLYLNQNLVDTFANADWGIYNSIINGGNEAGMWRTMTYNEWYYLIYNRANASKKRGIASVEGINGVILLPDNWTLPERMSFKEDFADEYNNPSLFSEYNSYTQTQWVIMENAGAIFLPAAGFQGLNYGNSGSVGLYWSSTQYPTNTSKYLFRVTSGANITHQSSYILSCVRLVQDIE